MIPGSRARRQPGGWQQEFAEAVTDPGELLRLLGLDGLADASIPSAETGFPLRVPHSFIRRMRPGDPDDPLLRQVLPTHAETKPCPGYSTDPLNESDAMPVPGLLHKYRGRVLLTLTGACAVNCRYCFRRHFPYGDANPARARWRESLAYLRDDTSVTEIILSGGDPLTIDDERLASLVGDLAEIDHLRRLRIHTRLPVVIPNRVTDALIPALSGTRLKPVVVLHINHPNEIDSALTEAAARLARHGIPLLNQSVLLKNNNDSVQALTVLSERLFEGGILPYYLHQLDPVLGAAHFQVTDARARELIALLRCRLPGYLVPRLVREQPGSSGKVPLDTGPDSFD